MKKPKYSLSIVIPTLNEINSISKTINIISKINIKKEIILVISRELTTLNTKIHLKKLKKLNSEIKIYFQKKPFVGGAVMTGIQKSKFSHIALMASDLETNPYHLNKLVSKSMRNKNFIICGDRWLRKNSFKNYGFINLMLNMFSQKLLKLFIPLNINDLTFAYRIYPKKALKNCIIKEFRNGWSLELLICPYKKNYNFLSVATTWTARNEGDKSNAIKNYISFFKILIYYLLK